MRSLLISIWRSWDAVPPEDKRKVEDLERGLPYNPKVEKKPRCFRCGEKNFNLLIRLKGGKWVCTDH